MPAQSQKVKKKVGRQPISKRRFSFDAFKAFIAELRKVVWPAREEVIRLSIMVIAVSLAVGILLGVLDYGFTQLTKLFFP